MSIAEHLPFSERPEPEPVPVIGVKMKKCRRCGHSLPADDVNFGLAADAKDGLNRNCRPCAREMKAIWKELHKRGELPGHGFCVNCRTWYLDECFSHATGHRASVCMYCVYEQTGYMPPEPTFSQNYEPLVEREVSSAK